MTKSKPHTGDLPSCRIRRISLPSKRFNVPETGTIGKTAVIWLCLPVIWFGGSTVSELDEGHPGDTAVRFTIRGSVNRPLFLLPPEEFLPRDELFSPRIPWLAENLLSPRKPEVPGPEDLDYQFR